MRQRVAALAVAALALTACTTPRHGATGIRIVSAAYSVQDGGIPCEVTTKVAAACNGQATCEVIAQSALCPMGDPAPNQPKRLSVVFACGATHMPTAQAAQGEALALTCPP